MSDLSKQELVSVAEHDYLDQDPPIRGQKYVCLSFISPEDAIANKESYFFKKFLHAFSSELTNLFTNMMNTYKDNNEFVDGLRGIQERYGCVFNGENLQDEYTFYKASNGTSLESEYLELNKFQTTIRGLKVRGSYETLKEAQLRAQLLKRMDDRFHVFIAEVGCWCPWSPNPEELENQEYAETHLNSLMKHYHDNQQKKDEFFLQRKDQLRKLALEDNEKKRATIIEEVDTEETDATQEAILEVASEECTKQEEEKVASVVDVEEKLQEMDPWQQRHMEEGVEPSEKST